MCWEVGPLNMSQKNKKVPVTQLSLLDAARQILGEHGENPDYWLLAASEVEGKQIFLCASPPFAAQPGYAGPLLGSILADNLSLAVRLTSYEHLIEAVAVAACGFLAPGLAKNPATPDESDYPPDYAQIVHVKIQADPLLALRWAMAEMFRLGYNRLKEPFPAQYGESAKFRLKVKPDGALAIAGFDPLTTVDELISTMGRAAMKAKLTRLRQTAQNCGGCGRCCHDGDIPLTYFDLGGLASSRFGDLYARQPALALKEVRTNFVISRPAPPTETLALVPAERLQLRKKDGATTDGSPCAFLDGRGLCSVYQGRPLLCRLYHCARSSAGLETLYYSVYYNLEWLGRAVESGLWRPELPITNELLFTQTINRLASPSALALVAQELNFT